MRLARIAVICVAALAAVVLAPPLSRAAATGCGSATQATIDAGYSAASWKIYEGELYNPEVGEDARHVERSQALTSALATGNASAVLASTRALVYHLRWHIVRLRVLSASGQLLADVGGPYILAPVRGVLSYRGAVVGRFVMSVQDDLGYTKLVSRFTGLPVEVYGQGRPLVGEGFPVGEVPAQQPVDGSTIYVAGVKSRALTFNVKAFPTGQSAVVLAVPLAGVTQTRSSCLAVKASVYTSIAAGLARQLELPSDVSALVTVDHEFDPDKLMFVYEGAIPLLGSPGFALPRHLPTSGQVTYGGRRWLVTSFAPVVGLRVYLLFPMAAPVRGSSGPTGAA